MSGVSFQRVLLSLASVCIGLAPTWSYWQTQCPGGATCAASAMKCCASRPCHTHAPRHCIIKVIPAADRIVMRAMIALPPLELLAIHVPPTILFAPIRATSAMDVHDHHPPSQSSPEEVLAPRGPPMRASIA